MTEQDLHQIIEEQAAEQKALMFQKYQQEAEQCVIEGARSRKKRKLNAIRWGSCVAVFALIVICLSVVLPITLNNDNIIYRYCYTDLHLKAYEYNLKTYSHNNGDKILIPDWYNNKTLTYLVCSPTDEDNIVFLQEEILKSNSEIKATIFIMKKNIQVDSFDTYENAPYNLELSNGVTAKYQISTNGITLKFEYDGYKYYFDFIDTTNINDVTPLLESMF